MYQQLLLFQKNTLKKEDKAILYDFTRRKNVRVVIIKPVKYISFSYEVYLNIKRGAVFFVKNEEIKPFECTNKC